MAPEQPMAKQPHQLLEKFRGWAAHEPVVKHEVLAAQEEFFAFVDRDRLEGSELLYGLFLEWFWFDRKTTAYLKTPAELYCQAHGRRFSQAERAIIESFQHTIFGLFEMLEVFPKEGMIHVRQFKTSHEWRVRDVKGSQSFKAGQILFARLIPMPGDAIFSGWVTGFPQSGGEFEKMMHLRFEGKKDVKQPTPREVLSLFVSPIRWEDKSAEFCRAKVASLWQRWNPTAMSYREMEQFVGEGDMSGFTRALQALIQVAPNPTDANEATKILNAYWNLASGHLKGDKPPIQKHQESTGPIEAAIVQRLMSESMVHFQATQKASSDEEVHAWLKNPANGVGGRTPHEMIIEERRRMGHPDPEKITFRIGVTQTERNNPAMAAANAERERALALMKEERFADAAPLLEGAYRVLKDHEELSFRTLGNLGSCYAVMGKREEALEAFRGALRHNPDYDMARQNLSYLESMGPAEYEAFRKGGAKRMVWKQEDEVGRV